MSTKRKSAKQQLREKTAELTELRRMLARIFPSGNRKYPHELWHQIRRLADHAQDLDELSTPMPARPTAVSDAANVDLEESTSAGAGGRSAEQPLFPGVRLVDREGDAGRTLYHAGTEYAKELQRITDNVGNMVNQSADWLRGLDRDPIPLPTLQRPRCQCGEIMATTWRYCPYCATPR